MKEIIDKEIENRKKQRENGWFVCVTFFLNLDLLSITDILKLTVLLFPEVIYNKFKLEYDYVYFYILEFYQQFEIFLSFSAKGVINH